LKVKNLTKACSKCKEVKNLSEYYKDKQRKDGFRHDCKSCNNAKNVAYRNANAEKVRATKKAYAEKTKERRREVMLAWQRANKDKVRLAGQQWNARNPGASSERSRRRRTKLNGNTIFAVSKNFINNLKSMPCAYCGTKGFIEIDHVVPISRGGTHSEGNLLPSCITCNRSKGDRTITEWTKLRRLAK
jgi:5-methylcytosine-specific restriction endonuclease McrA